MRSDNAPPPQVLHRDVGDRFVADDVVHRDDIAVRQLRHHAAFEQEAPFHLARIVRRAVGQCGA
jgi:hypothetical protein